MSGSPASQAVGPATAPTAGRTGFFHWLGFGLLVLVTILGAGWTLLALWYQASADWRFPAMSGVIAAAIGLILLGWNGGLRQAIAWGWLAVLALAVGLWWSMIQPSDSRNWIPEVAHGVTGVVEGQRVTLSNVRDFEWRTETDFTPRWQTRTYDLDDLTSVDLFSSVWDSPAIAHTLVGFGFRDGAHVVFSAEIRREEGEAFSEIGGFFKEFELVLIAAEENDIVRLRTDARGERVSRFPLQVTPEQARAMFLAYVELGNRLAEKPAFYQTVTSNCTTIIYQLARLVDGRVPLDWRILMSGHLPGYLYDLGLVRTDLPLEAVVRKALIHRVPGDGRPFSQAIRAAP